MGISKTQLEDAMESYGNLRYQIEAMKSNMKTVIEKIIESHPEIKNEIDSAKEELEGQILKAEKIEKQQKHVLDSMIEQYAESAIIKDEAELKTSLLRVGLKKEVKYDSKALDGKATSDPTLLAFRTEKITHRVTLNKL